MQQNTNAKTVSRRAFLKSMVIGLALVAAAPIAQACAPAAPAPTQAPAAEPTKAAEPTQAPAAATMVPEPTKAPAASSGAKTPVRLVVMDYDDRMAKDTQAVIDAFNQSQDKIEAKVDVVSWNDGYTVLTTQVSGLQAPDLANVSAGWLLTFAAAGEVEPLESYVEPDFLTNFVPAALEHMKVEGKLMALPYFEDSRGIYYRTDLFEKAGLKPPTTWDEMREVAKKLHNPPDVYGIGLGPGDYWWYAWIGAVGGEGNQSPWGPDKCLIVDGEAGVAACQHLVDLALVDKTTQPSPVKADRDKDLQPLFMAGKLAMLETGPWFHIILGKDAPDIKFDVAPLAVAKPGMKSGNVAWPDAVCLFKQSKDKGAAAELMKFMFSKENRLAFTKQRGNPPERLDVGADPSFGTNKFEKFFFEQTKVAFNVYQSPWPADYVKDFTEVQNAYSAAILGEMKAAEAMKKAADTVNKSHGL